MIKWTCLYVSNLLLRFKLQQLQWKNERLKKKLSEKKNES